MSDQPKRVPEPVRLTLDLFRSMLASLSSEHRAMVLDALKIEVKEHCPRRLMGEHQEPHAPCDTGDFSKDK